MGGVSLYSDNQKKELTRAIGEYLIDQLLWRILYLNSVASNWEGSEEIRGKLLSLPSTFKLIIDNIERTPAGKELYEAINEETKYYVQYVNSTLNGENNLKNLKKLWDRSIERGLNALSRIYPKWNQMEWDAMISHQQNLLENILMDVKAGKYDTLPTIIPNIRRLTTDISQYLSKGFIDKENSNDS